MKGYIFGIAVYLVVALLSCNVRRVYDVMENGTQSSFVKENAEMSSYDMPPIRYTTACACIHSRGYRHGFGETYLG